jgi:hypothetical protein
MLFRDRRRSLRYSREAILAEHSWSLGLGSLSTDTVAAVGAMNDASTPSVGGY